MFVIPNKVGSILTSVIHILEAFCEVVTNDAINLEYVLKINQIFEKKMYEKLNDLRILDHEF